MSLKQPNLISPVDAPINFGPDWQNPTMPASRADACAYSRRLPRPVTFLFFSVLMLLYVPRIWTMGFYADDWFVFFWRDLFDKSFFLEMWYFFGNRPVVVPFYWISSLIIDWSPVRAQAFSVAMSVAAALSIGLVARALASAFGQTEARTTAFWLAALLFLVQPWNLSLTAWPTATAILLSIVLLGPALHLLMLPGPAPVGRLVGGGLFLAASFLSYETFYFQATLLLTLAVLVTEAGPARAYRLKAVILSGLINLACLGYNRLSGAQVRKSLNPDFFSIFITGYGRLGDILEVSFGPYAAFVWSSILFASLVAVAILFLCVGVRRAALLHVVAGGGVLGAGLLYSAAGYGITAVSYNSRSLLGLSFYTALVIALGLGIAVARLSLPVRLAGWTGVITLVSALSLATHDRNRDWAESWSAQLKVFQNLPPNAEQALSQGRAVVYLSPGLDRPVWIATARHETIGALSYGVYLQDPTRDRRSQFTEWKRHWYTASPTEWVSWDGTRLVQGACPDTRYGNYEASKVFAWHESDATFRAVDSPFVVGCEKAGPQVFRSPPLQ